MTLRNIVRRVSVMVGGCADSETIGAWRFNETKGVQPDKSRRCTISGVANFFEVPVTYCLAGRVLLAPRDAGTRRHGDEFLRGSHMRHAGP